ncbi:cyclin-dependent kinase inhibitor 2c-related [Anaeramoeba flamelloides]|uniref:Cyclin-dependent kinase inhibitor 2c-related n=1 Tax=Anaeramoeba flamelloides TaxID=1746091 RepID=A0ABQ8YWX0_9EUKA|nr:cyclin-dependent kinase inhibitor 2c-related [Anaeramoeba flamelloides]
MGAKLEKIKKAIQEDNLSSIERLLQKKHLFNLPKNEIPLLHRTIISGSINCMLYIINYPNHDVDIRDNKYGLTSLHLSSLIGNKEIMKTLLVHGADPNAVDNKGRTPLFCVSFKGNLDLFNLLVEYKANPKAKDDSKKNVLHYAILNKIFNSKFTKCLLKMGFKIESQDNKGRTPLQLAVYHGRFQAVDFLIQKGAKKEVKNGSLIHIACMGGKSINKWMEDEFGKVKVQLNEVDRIFEKTKNALLDQNTTLNEIFFEKDNNNTDLKIKNKTKQSKQEKEKEKEKEKESEGSNIPEICSNFFEKDKVYTKPILNFNSIQNLNKFISKEIIENEETEKKKTQENTEKENKEQEKEKKQEEKRQEEHKNTESKSGSEKEKEKEKKKEKKKEKEKTLGKEKKVEKEKGKEKTLEKEKLSDNEKEKEKVKEKENMNKKEKELLDQDGKNKNLYFDKLYEENVSVRIKVLQHLFDLGIDINTKNSSGLCPIHIACQVGILRVVKWLITHGVDVNSLTKEKRTPISYSIYYGHLPLFEYLLQEGANPLTKDANGKTSLYWAKKGKKNFESPLSIKLFEQIITKLQKLKQMEKTENIKKKKKTNKKKKKIVQKKNKTSENSGSQSSDSDSQELKNQNTSSENDD